MIKIDESKISNPFQSPELFQTILTWLTTEDYEDSSPTATASLSFEHRLTRFFTVAEDADVTEGAERLLTIRQVCKSWRNQVDGFLQILWNYLKDNASSDMSDYSISLVDEIKTIEGQEKHPLLRFKKLTQLFIYTSPQVFCIYSAEFHTLQKQYGFALKKIWSVVHHRLTNPMDELPAETEIPGADAAGKVIREFFNQDANQIKLNRVTLLPLSDLGLIIVPNEFIKLKKIDAVDFSCNKIRVFSVLGSPELTSICLMSNKLRVPFNIDKYSKLKCISVSENELKKIPSIKNGNEITCVLFENNKLTVFPDLRSLNMANIFDFNCDSNRFLSFSEDVCNQFKDYPFVESFKAQLSYQTHTDLGQLYQSIMKQEDKEVQMKLFSLLNLEDQNIFFQKIWEEAGKPFQKIWEETGHSVATCSIIWGRQHAFEDMHRFRLALQELILEKFNSLDREKKIEICKEIAKEQGSLFLLSLDVNDITDSLLEKEAKKNIVYLIDLLWKEEYIASAYLERVSLN